ncbi:DNA polymerase III subunit chi [Pusillimonas sp.]|uniref:DNA polymerase III subunit chi n=1 Tax=Pusillimonas sp. TaxID=3040095 RepID=UPI0037C600DA
MTARVDFAFGAPDRLRMACDVVRKHYDKGRRLVVYCADATLLERFDLMLWGFEATAFVPHVAADDPLAAQTPILLTDKAIEPPGSDPAPWLVNLDEQCPPAADRYERILEIVSRDEASVQAARQRWRQYKSDGYDLHAHDLSRNA